MILIVRCKPISRKSGNKNNYDKELEYQRQNYYENEAVDDAKSTGSR